MPFVSYTVCCGRRVSAGLSFKSYVFVCVCVCVCVNSTFPVRLLWSLVLSPVFPTAQQAFEECDTNHDGQLSFDEFKLWYSGHN